MLDYRPQLVLIHISRYLEANPNLKDLSRIQLDPGQTVLLSCMGDAQAVQWASYRLDCLAYHIGSTLTTGPYRAAVKLDLRVLFSSTFLMIALSHRLQSGETCMILPCQKGSGWSSSYARLACDGLGVFSASTFRRGCQSLFCGRRDIPSRRVKEEPLNI